MIKDNILYHNVAELEKTAFGDKLHRYPIKAENGMNYHARWMSRFNCGCELRFVSEAEYIDVTLLAEEGEANVLVLRGDYVCARYQLEPGKITTLKLTAPTIADDNIDDEFYKNNRFSKDVWRIYMHNGSFTVCSIDSYGYSVRPPHKDEMPEKTLLTYGSSITHGAGAMLHYSCYANQLAVRLKSDVLIKGLGGSCHCDKTSIDYMTSSDEWDMALLEPAINMVGAFEIDEFEKRVNYLISEFAKTGKKIFVTTIYPFSKRFMDGENENEKSALFDDVLRKTCVGFKNVYLAEGGEILTDTEFLSADGIHPCDYGHFMMAQNWYNKIKDVVK